MGGFLIKPTKTPIGFGGRLKHVAENHWRGVCGFLLACCFFPPFAKGKMHTQAFDIWMIMIIHWIFQTVTPPVVGLIPVFLGPLCNLYSSAEVAGFYYDDNIAFFVLGSMVLLLFNNSGLDRRVILNLMCRLDEKLTPTKFMINASIAAFLMSALSNRLIATCFIMDLTSKAFLDRVRATSGSKTEPNYNEKDVINCCIAASASIGSFAVIHASPTVCAFKAIWHGGWNTIEFPDVFNYMQYMLFSVPLSVVCLAFTITFYALLMKGKIKQPLSTSSSKAIRDVLRLQREKLAPFSPHEKQSLVFTLLFFIILSTRWCHLFPNNKLGGIGGGWSQLVIEKGTTEIPMVRDCSVAALFCIILCVLPRDLKFLKIFSAKKKSDLPPAKSPSAILFWRFVDMNVNYGYMLIMGGGIGIDTMFAASRFNASLASTFSTVLEKLGFELTLLLFLVVTAILANLTVGIAAVAIFLPFVKAMGTSVKNHPWPSRHYLGALGVGITASFGFMSSYRYTPQFYAKKIGRTSTITMVKLGFIPLIINVVIVWVFLMMYAPAVFDPRDEGINAIWIAAGAPSANKRKLSGSL